MNNSICSWRYGNEMLLNKWRVTLLSDISMKGNPLEWIIVCDLLDGPEKKFRWMQRRVTLLLDKGSKGNPLNWIYRCAS